MVQRKELVEFLDDLLRPPPGCTDSSNNGLQVEGRREVRKVALGVDACVTLFAKAATAGADFVIVHHGLSWGDNLRRLTGISARRLAPLFRHGISLYASHLPLDAHAGIEIGWYGRLPKAVTLAVSVNRENVPTGHSQGLQGAENAPPASLAAA